MKILLLEDDRKLAALVRKGLETQGFMVDACSDGNEAFTLASTRAYDALVLDVMVPAGRCPSSSSPPGAPCPNGSRA